MHIVAGALEIFRFPAGPLATNGYLVAVRGERDACLIDAPPESCELFVRAITAHQLTPRQLLLTHSHWDHIADAHALQQRYQLDVCVHEEDAYNLQEPGADGLACPPTAATTPTRLLHDGDQLAIGSSTWQVLHTPGHAPGCICLYCPKEGVLFSGDTLFRGTYGSLSLPTSQAQRMRPSLQRLATLPPATRVFPGHGESTTIGAEGWLLERRGS